MSMIHSSEYWQDMECRVADRVRAELACHSDNRGPTIVFLRRLEEKARKEIDRNQTVQIIASGRRLLGDKTNLGNASDQSAYDLFKQSL